MLSFKIPSVLNFSRIKATSVKLSLKAKIDSRSLSIHEYLSQDLLRKHEILVPKGAAASTVEEAIKIAASLGTNDLVVKAQVLAGGRGKGHFSNGYKSGVHVCSTPEEVGVVAGKMLGSRLITKQTTLEGQPCNKVLVAQRHYIRREMYFAILLDRITAGPVLVGSSEGGMDIEAVAHENPDAIVKIPIDIWKGPTNSQLEQMAKGVGLKGNAVQVAAGEFKKLYDLFIKKDCTLVEINPMVETASGEIFCLDAKLSFDDNAAFRQPDIFALRDFSQEDEREVAAAKADLNFIGLDGNIGCLVNGAGLAMATMDLIKLNGGSPANFLDVGGGATEKQVSEAFKILSRDPNVRAILVNIFGGIMRCDVIALGIINAVQTLGLRLPVVVRLQGTMVEEAKKLLDNSGLRILPADDLDAAAKKAVKVAEIVKMAKEVSLGVSFELPL